MQKLKLYSAFFALPMLLSACSMPWLSQYSWCESSQQYEYQCPDEKPVVVTNTQEKTQIKTTMFTPQVNFQTLGEYTEQMVHVLHNKLSVEKVSDIIAVPPFLSLTDTLPNQDALTRDLPEFFIADLQNIGFPVAEYHLTNDGIKTNEDFNELVSDLKFSQKFGFLLKGTIRPNDNGVMLYVKVIDLETELVIASTSKLLPNYLIAKSAL